MAIIGKYLYIYIFWKIGAQICDAPYDKGTVPTLCSTPCHGFIKAR